MDLVTLTVATDRVEFRCNSELAEADRTTALERMTRLVQAHQEIVRMYVDLERDHDSDNAAFIAKGQVEISPGPDLLASVADHDAVTAIEFLLEKFDRQLRRRSRVGASLRAARNRPTLS